MSFTLRIHIGEKRSPAQYETVSVAADITAENLEIRSPEEIQAKLREMQMIARSAVQSQLLEMMPSNASGHPSPHATVGGNGNGAPRPRSYGRPQPEGTPKQKQLIQKIARERNLDAQSIGAICESIVGKPVRQCDRHDLSRLIDHLLADAA